MANLTRLGSSSSSSSTEAAAAAAAAADRTVSARIITGGANHTSAPLQAHIGSCSPPSRAYRLLPPSRRAPRSEVAAPPRKTPPFRKHLTARKKLKGSLPSTSTTQPLRINSMMTTKARTELLTSPATAMALVVRNRTRVLRGRALKAKRRVFSAAWRESFKSAFECSVLSDTKQWWQWGQSSMRRLEMIWWAALSLPFRQQILATMRWSTMKK